MQALIAVLAGDGIGPEVTDQAVRVLAAIAGRAGHSFGFEPALLGGAAIDATGKRTAELIPGAKLHIVKDGPHGLNWTHATEVNTALLQFLK